MFIKEIMDENFEKIKGETKQNLISVFGEPQSIFFSFAMYKNTNMSMVLYFEDTHKNGILFPCLKGAAFFDEQNKCIWSGGIRLVSENKSSEIKDYRKVSEMIAEIGEPHGIIGEGFSALQYLSEDGKFILIKHKGDDILDISYRTLF